MNKPIASKIQVLIPFILVVVGMHMSIMFSLLKTQNTALFISTHVYLIFFLLLNTFVLPIVKKSDKTKVGFAFLAITVFKMLFGVILVYFFIKTSGNPNLYVLSNFFAPFFIYLIAEVLIALRELNN